jgi:transforming growth factor-beta-induced protein
MFSRVTKVMPLMLSMVLLAVGVAPALAAPAYQADKDIVDIAVEDGRFTTLVAAVQAAGLVDTLKGEGPFTVFAPTDEAFAKLPAGTVEALLTDIPTLTDILLYHVVSGKVMASDVVNLTSADTVLGQPVSIKVEGDKVMINDAQVIITDIEASNGVIHVIDSVLLPPEEAPAALPVTGGELKLQADKDIVDIAVEDGRFTTLVTAVQAAGLVDTLKGEGPFTVFAPTDDAFAKLPAGTVEALLNDVPALTDILLYHVVSGKVMASDVVNLTSADTVLGQPVSITVDGDKVMINDAQVIITDIEASNGVIHVIDSVLLPPQETPAALPATGGENALDVSFLTLLALGLALVVGGVALSFAPVQIFNRK